MGGWRADGSSSAASPARSRRGEARGPRSSLGARHDLSVNWRDAMRPVRDAAALGRNGADALRDATLRFFADAKNKGVPSTAEMDKKETASDLLTLVRAVNGFSATKDLSSLRRGVDALVADLVALDAVALDNEVVAVLCAYYVARFSRRKDAEKNARRRSVPERRRSRRDLRRRVQNRRRVGVVVGRFFLRSFRDGVFGGSRDS
jgi:hypothetical protein